ncbi:MAG: NAD-dependent epimerase/dehydratase family protein [Candidatus Wallbacteria bacterium]
MNDIILEDINKIISSNIDIFSKFKGRNFLITGINGFLPSYLALTLMKFNDSLKDNEKIKIIGIARNERNSKLIFNDYYGNWWLKFLFQDVCEKIKINDNVDYIIHAASHASPKYYGSDPVGTLMPNIIGTVNLFEYAKNCNIKNFLFFSSSEIYGQVAEKDNPINENCHGYIDPCNIRSCYAESKRMGETICTSYNSQFKIPVKIARIFHTYGPGMDLNDGRVFADFVSCIVNNRNITLNSNGQAERPFCYIADTIEALFKMINSDNYFDVFNVGNPYSEVKIIDLANILVNLFAEKKLKVIINDNRQKIGYIKSSIQKACPDISKLKKLDWSPKFSIEEGFKRTIRSYIE